MESTESDAAAESPEVLTQKSQESDSTEKPTHIRFLVSNASAGSVIGKGGSTITQLKSFIEDSKERMRAVALILTKLTEDDDYSVQVHSPNSYAGLSDEHIGVVIGRGGSQIKVTSQLSGATIKISGRGDFVPGTTDRRSS